MNLHAGHFLLLTLAHQGVELGSAVANQSPQVAHKLVDEPLPLHFADHVTVVIIPKRELENDCLAISGVTENYRKFVIREHVCVILVFNPV